MIPRNFLHPALWDIALYSHLALFIQVHNPLSEPLVRARCVLTLDFFILESNIVHISYVI